jgi:Spy/CpxP family protein refolding chaperone
MNPKSHLITALLIVATATAWAQQPSSGRPAGPGAPGQQRQGAPDVMSENLFPPELIMHNQKTLNLSEDQIKTIREEMQKTMAKFTDLQWQQSAEAETLSGLLKQDKVDEKQAVAELDKLLGIENEIKKLHFGAMLKVDNLLTSEQKTKLRQMRPQFQQQPLPQGARGPGAGRPRSGEQPPPPPREEE